MHLMELLHKTFKKELSIHKIRLKALMDALSALIQGNKLTLTGLGRSIKGKTQPRSNIKRIDRLIGKPSSSLSGKISIKW